MINVGWVAFTSLGSTYLRLVLWRRIALWQQILEVFVIGGGKKQQLYTHSLFNVYIFILCLYSGGVLLVM